MKIITLLSFLFLLPILLTSQKKVGIGHSSPQSALHIHQENQLQDPPAALQLSNGGTGSALSDGLRMYVLGPDAFLNNQEINGRLSLGTNSNSVINILNSGKIGINSDQVLGSSDLTITSLSLSSYGGMYINCLDVNGGRPFYGYAMAGNTSCWTYFDKSTDQWIVSNTGSRFFVRNSGQVGIGVSEPTQKLEVAGRIKLSTEPTIEEVGVIQYKDGDFSGYKIGRAHV